MAETRAVSDVQEALLDAIQKKGIESVLSGIGAWYVETAKAKMEDEFSRQLGERKDDREGRILVLSDSTLDAARCVSNYSTSPGQNLMMQADAAVRATELSRLTAGKRTLAWNAWQEQKSK